MPNRLSQEKRRVTYAEWNDIYEQIQRIAKAERRDVSDVLRKATQHYIERYGAPDLR